MLQQNSEERPLGELFGDLFRGISDLVRQEFQLAKSEMSQKATEVGKQVGFLAIGGMLAFTALLVLEAAAVLALAKVLPAWGAALVVGGVVLVVASILVMKGLNALKNQDMTPRQTVETLKEDTQWLKQQAK